jgi:hypothetical protein
VEFVLNTLQPWLLAGFCFSTQAIKKPVFPVVALELIEFTAKRKTKQLYTQYEELII